MLVQCLVQCLNLDLDLDFLISKKSSRVSYYLSLIIEAFKAYFEDIIGMFISIMESGIEMKFGS